MNRTAPLLQSVPSATDTAELAVPAARTDATARLRSSAWSHRAPPTIAMQAIVTLAPGRHPAWVECLFRPASGEPIMDAVRAGYAARGARFDLEVIDAALAQAAILQPSTRIGINIHPDSLARPGFVDAVLATARRRHIAPDRLVLELVEFDGAVVLADSRDALTALRAAGIAIALDDFGPGAPNFDVVAAGLVDWIKLDRSLCAPIDRQPGARRVLAGLVALVRHAGPGLVAEGVERPAQMRILRDLGVVHQQGFLFNRPIAAGSPRPSGRTH